MRCKKLLLAPYLKVRHIRQLERTPISYEMRICSAGQICRPLDFVAWHQRHTPLPANARHAGTHARPVFSYPARNPRSGLALEGERPSLSGPRRPTSLQFTKNCDLREDTSIARSRGNPRPLSCIRHTAFNAVDCDAVSRVVSARASPRGSLVLLLQVQGLEVEAVQGRRDLSAVGTVAV